MWKVVDSKEVFKHPRLTLIEDTVSLPDGKQFNYLRWKDDGACAVTIIALNNDNQILLQKEYSHPPKKILFQFPGGGVPKDESPESGANRELMEEAKLYANSLELLGSYYVNNRLTSKKMFVFLAKNLEKMSLQSDIMEEIGSLWLNEEEIDEKIKNGEIDNCYALSAWMLFKNRQ